MQRTGNIDIDWTIERGRDLANSLRVVATKGDTRSALNVAEQAAVLVWDTWKAKGASMDAYGWRYQGNFADSLEKLTHAYQSLAASFGEPYIIDGEPQNGATISEER